MVPDHGFARVGTMQVQAIIPPLSSGCLKRAMSHFKALEKEGLTREIACESGAYRAFVLQWAHTHTLRQS